MWNARLNEAEAGIKIARRNINNLRYTDDTTLMEESEEKLKSLLMKVKEESEKAALKLSIQKMKITASGPITSGGKVKTVTAFILGGSKITTDDDCSHEIKRCLFLGRKAMTNLLLLLLSRFSRVRLCDPVDCSTPALPVRHQLPELTQIHVHRVGNAIQPSHFLLIPSPPAFNPSQHQGLFQWVTSSHQVTKVLELQHQSFQWIFRTDFL